MAPSSRTRLTKKQTGKRSLTSQAQKTYSVKDVVQLPLRFLLDPDYFWYTATILLIGEFFLNLFIIQRVPYTEIDWIAYMQEVGGFLAGERDYLKLKGDTGPLVYPAGFVWVYSGLYYVTENGTNIRRAQYIFAALYLATQYVVFSIYRASERVPPLVIVLLCLSKRLHSIFVLRCFNDPVAMFLLYCAILAMIHKQYRVASILFSLGVSVKMNVLLFFPAFGLLLWKAEGARPTLVNIACMGGLQRLIAWPFLKENSASYISKAFEFGRVFDYEWTVNWRMLDEETFASKAFANLLLTGHALLILGFLCTKWCRKEEGGVIGVFRRGWSGKTPVTADDIIFTMFTCNLIGIVFSRSLHYQFYSWYFHTLPYLVWQAKWEGNLTYTTAAKGLILATIEVSWLTFPSTFNSSCALLACHFLLVTGLFRSESKPYRMPEWLAKDHAE